MAVTETTTQTTKATVAPQGANNAPKATTPTWKATPTRKAPKSPKAANRARVTRKAASKKTEPKKAASSKPASKEGRAGTKSAKVLDLIRRPNGATLKEIMKATGWQPHSVRGFISGSLNKKMGLKVESVKREDGERTYRIAK